jgi:tRNA threonylcarbamoyladenosine dehydratase
VSAIAFNSDVVTVESQIPKPKPFRLHRRFDRTGRLFGDGALQRLAQSRVVVFGLGGVGGYAVEGLVRSGVGNLTLVDFDVVCVTNSNRQLQATVSTVGKSKAELLAQRCLQINPEAKVNAVVDFYREEQSEALLAGSIDFVIDAIDNVKAKLHLLQACVKRNIRVVSSMGAAGRVDPTAIRIDDLCNTHMDPLAKDVRKLLRRKYELDTAQPTGITAVYSIEPRRQPYDLHYDEASGGFRCVCPHGDNGFHSCEHRNQIDGSAVFVTSVFGMHMASVVVRQLAEAARIG